MAIKTRLIILALCCLAFLVLTPYLVLYSLGYRIDFANMKVVATGGIYVYVAPEDSQVAIDETLQSGNGLFSSYIFQQNLLPGLHIVSIKKDGYYEYHKSLEVLEKEVTKLENVVLFKKDLVFDMVTDAKKIAAIQQLPKEQFVIKSGNLYPTETSEDMPLLTTPVIKKIAAYTVADNSILWLGTDGFLYRSSMTGANPEKLSTVAIVISAKKTYQIINTFGDIFLKSGDAFLIFDRETKIFANLHSLVKNMAVSPNNQSLLFYNDSEIFYTDSQESKTKSVFLKKSKEKITQAAWVNDHYIIFTKGNSIAISEIDVRGNVNEVTLRGPTSTQLQNPKIFFPREENRLYIITGKTTIVSEKLIP